MSSSNWRKLIARKPHVCLWCSERIEKGTEYTLEEWADGDEHGRNRYHVECEAAVSAAGYDIIEWWSDEGCVPDFQRGHIHEVGSDTVEAESKRGCPACKSNEGDVS